MRQRMKTVKTRLIVVMVAFVSVVAVLISVFSYTLLYSFQRRTSVQSAETNLQLVASLIDQDLTTIQSLAGWCSQSSDIANFFTAPEYNSELALKAFDRTYEEAWGIRSNTYNYIQRLVVMDSETDRLIQVRAPSTSRTLTKYNAQLLMDDFEVGDTSAWDSLRQDPLSQSDGYMLMYLCPVKNTTLVYDKGPVYYQGDSSVIGTVYIAVSPEIVTDKLTSHAYEGSELLLTIGGQSYRFSDNGLEPVEQAFTQTNDLPELAALPHTNVASVKSAEGGSGTMVSYPIRSGITLTQVLYAGQYAPSDNMWVWLLIGIIVVIVTLAVTVMLSLDKHISRPVARLRQKVDAVAAGDFSQDPFIESDSEIGLVGRGVNRLSHEVVELMEKRLADEKGKQELEYRMLQSQINPHFVYNTLNSIKWMATLQSADGIAEMTTALSRLLKTVSKDLRKVVPLREELALLDDYFLIQQYRYGGAVTLNRNIEDEALLEAPIPRFALQPLVENAIFHGIEPKGAGQVTLEVKRENGDVLVRITDDGVGMPPAAIQAIYDNDGEEAETDSRHLGVYSVHQRLRHVFGEGYGLQIESKLGSYTTMTLRIPEHETGIEGGKAS